MNHGNTWTATWIPCSPAFLLVAPLVLWRSCETENGSREVREGGFVLIAFPKRQLYRVLMFWLPMYQTPSLFCLLMTFVTRSIQLPTMKTNTTQPRRRARLLVIRQQRNSRNWHAKCPNIKEMQTNWWSEASPWKVFGENSWRGSFGLCYDTAHDKCVEELANHANPHWWQTARKERLLNILLNITTPLPWI